MLFGLDKCFVLVFNSKSKKPEDLPSFYLKGRDNRPHRLPSYYPDKTDKLHLGYNPTDLITRTKIDGSTAHPLSLIPNFRKKPNPKYLKRIRAKFNRSRHGVNQLCPDKTILTPKISIRIYKTLQRSTLLYAM